MDGRVYVGLCHQSHGANNAHNLGGNTAVFDHFRVSEFGTFTTSGGAELTLSGDNVFLNQSATPLGGDPEEVTWRLDYVGAGLVATPGFLKADIFMQNNGGNLVAFNAMTQQAPDGSTLIERILWSSNNYAQTNAAGVNLFAEAVPGSFGGGQNQYGVNLTGEIFIPGDASRGGVESILFHDGADDFCVLEIDGVTLINDNNWTNSNGQGGNGGRLAGFDCSAAKFDDGQWVSFRMGMWEGGGGDSNNLVWDALDRTGTDDVTGGSDGILNSFSGQVANIDQNIQFAHSASDEIPSVNFRALAAGAVFTETGNGTTQGQVQLRPLTGDVTELRFYLNDSLLQTIPVTPVAISAGFTAYQEATIVLADVADGGSRDVDENSMTITRNGIPVTPLISKDGLLTTIVDTFDTPPSPLAQYAYRITGTTTADTGAVEFIVNVSAEAFPLYEVMRAGLSDPPNATIGWDLMEFTGVGGDRFFTGQEAIRNNPPAAQAVAPFINHTDPDTNLPAGDWPGDRPILTDSAGVDDNNYITFARTIWTAVAGDYTIRVRGDDGYCLRINGASVVAIKGAAGNKAGADGSSAYFRSGTGNSNAYIQINIADDGDYLVEFFAFEGGGGSNQEILVNSGRHENLNDSGWELLGDMSQYVPVSRWGDIPGDVLPELPSFTGENGWATRIWYQARNGAGQDVGNLDQTMRFLRDLDAGTSTSDAEFAGFLETLNHSATGGNAGRINPTEAYPDPNGGIIGGPVVGSKSGDRIAMLAHGRLIVPVDGDYTIQIRSDDGFLLRFLDPANSFHTANGNGRIEYVYPSEVSHQNGTGDSNTRVAAYLAAGEHDIAFVWWEGGGGDHFELSVAAGIQMNQNGPFVLLDRNRKTNNLYLGRSIAPPFDITDIRYDALDDEFSITWDSQPGDIYALYFSPDLMDWGADLDDSISSGGESTVYGPFSNPVPGTRNLFFRVEKVPAFQ